MRKINLLLIVICSVLIGCATPIKYGFDKSQYKHPDKTNLRVVVNQFQDLRTEDEHEGTFSATKGFDYTKDSLFAKDISKQITDMIVKHLEYSNIFEAVATQTLTDFSLDNNEQVDDLIAQGFDYVIQGDLHHFYGYQTTASGAAGMFGLVGVLTEAMVNKKMVGGRATLGDVKIIDLANRKILWAGDLDHEFEEKDTFYDGAPAYAIKSLKNVNEKLVEKLNEVISVSE